MYDFDFAHSQFFGNNLLFSLNFSEHNEKSLKNTSTQPKCPYKEQQNYPQQHNHAHDSFIYHHNFVADEYVLVILWLY